MSEKILIFMPGTIGDLITAIPAMQRIRNFHRNAEIHFYNSRFCKNDIHRTLLDHMNLFDKTFFRQVPERITQQPWKRISNWYLLFREHYNIIYELPCNTLTPKYMFKAFRAGKVFAPDCLEPAGVPRFRYLLNFLADSGIPRTDGDEVVNWNFQPEEIINAEAWFSKIKIPEEYTPFIVCTGGKSPLQHWPLERYAEFLKKIVPEYRLFPVFVGVGADEEDAGYLIKECGMGVFSQNVGPLSLREMILAFQNFKFYLGNDTGILHIAGAAGIPSLSVSSARAPENFWTPLNDLKHISVVADVACKNCRRNYCYHKNSVPCMENIKVQDLLKKILQIYC